ncbi:aconitate hydratase [Citrobacter murliniae]|uniref:Aconitate hydratase n=1 Tax=Citrobacter murliniae TaxID=67829 RepID=A0ABY2PX57_9ENTR|nr:aconitate hydratase [Citrobacter werkmanii]RFU92428.1 aconitate hydratase [Citrobacter gillenii]THE40417.1 aconitate hydratase [Citrobacter murliniae]
MRYRAFTLQTAVSQEREENRLPHMTMRARRYRRARRIP